MIEPSELEQRILAELDEAGEEDVPTMMLMTMPVVGEAGEIVTITAALHGLLTRDLIRMSNGRDEARRLAPLSESASRSVISELVQRLNFDPKFGTWNDRTQTGPSFGEPYPFILRTDAGAAASRDVLKRRGYRWW